MKKILTLLIISLMFIGCNSDEPDAKAEKEVKKEETTKKDTSEEEIKFRRMSDVSVQDYETDGMHYKIFNSQDGLVVINITKDIKDCRPSE